MVSGIPEEHLRRKVTCCILLSRVFSCQMVDGVDDCLKELIKETCDQLNVEIIEMEIMPDHVHLLMEVDPQYGIHKAVKRIKGYSSRVLRQEFPWLKSRIPTLWTNSYFVSTVGGAPLSVIKQYIEDQKNV